MSRFNPFSVAGSIGWVVVGLIFAPSARAQDFQTLEDGPIHEAFLPAVTDLEPLEAVPVEPPPPVTERIPPKCDGDVEWIAGYWEWDPDKEDYFWVGGCWRKPPPGKQWIATVWKPYDAGWVRIPGFWSAEDEDDLEFLDEAPPDPVDEEAPQAPGSGYFWLAGYWVWSDEHDQYIRYTGRWHPLDPNWVLVPAHYVFRPDGYVFVPAYWDWPVDRRGCTYASIYVEPAARVHVVYEPRVIVTTPVILNHCYVYYPDYTYIVYHHHHYHVEWWHAHYDLPPWWGWDTWWAMPRHHHWGVWWWYTHPGYPHPHWMSVSVASRIHPPSHKTVIIVKNKIKAPKIITVNGVIAPSQTLVNAKKAKAKHDDDKHDHGKGKKEKAAPVVASADAKSQAKAAAEPEKHRKKEERAEEPLLPTGKKLARGEKDDQPPPPRARSNRPEVVKARDNKPSRSITDNLENSKKKPEPLTKSGGGDGKDKDKEPSKNRLNEPATGTRKPPQPPIQDKSRGKSEDKTGGKPGRLNGDPRMRIDDKSKSPSLRQPNQPKDSGNDKDKFKERDSSKKTSAPTFAPSQSRINPPPPTGGSSSSDKNSKFKPNEKKIERSPSPPPIPGGGRAGGREKENKDRGDRKRDRL